MSNFYKWIDPSYKPSLHNQLNNMVVMKRQIDSISGEDRAPNILADVMAGFNFTEFLGFTSLQDVLTSITYFPIDLEQQLYFGFGDLTVNGSRVVGDSKTVEVATLNNKYYQSGFHICEHYVESNNSYTDYEPYCSTEIWLPYCGKINLPRPKIVGKYVEVFLFIDYATGNAQYVIATSTSTILESIPNRPFLYESTPFFFINEIIATEDFVLGYKYPIGRTGLNDYLRNTAVGIAKTAAAIYGASTITPASLVPKEHSVAYQGIAKSGRLKTYAKEITKDKVPKSAIKNYRKSTVAMTTAASIGSLSQNQMQGSVANTNNPMMMYHTCQSVHFVTTKSKLVPYNSFFDKTYGRPLGQAKRLYQVGGFTDLSNIKIEGDKFNRALEEEIDMLETIMLSGVILPRLPDT